MQRFTHASHLTNLNLWLWLALLFTSCEDSFMKQATANKMGAVANLQTTLDSEGNFVAQIDPTKAETQLMRITEGAIAGAAVAIPPSALSIPVSIMVGEGVALTTNSFSQDLGLTGNAIAAGGPSVSFTASQDVVASNPLTLSIPFGALSFALAEVDTDNLVVMYRWMTLKDGEPSYEVGVIPGDKVTRGQNKVSFQTTKFGTFQVGISETKITKPLLAATEEPPALKSCERYAAAAFPTCTQDGQVGCVTTESFKAADLSLAKSEFILAGKTMASVTGNVTLPDPGKVLTNTSYGAGGIEKSGTLTLPDPSKVLASSASYGNPSSPTTPTLTDRGVWDLKTSFAGAGYYSSVTNMPTAASIVSGTTVLGLNIPAAPTVCSNDGDNGCLVLGPNFAAAAVSASLANNILHPSKIGGITGNVFLPSEADVKYGVQFGASSALTGNMLLGPTVSPCASNNQIDCVANPDFPSVQKSSIEENAPKFLNTLNIAGVTGGLSICATAGTSNCYLPPYDVTNQLLKALNTSSDIGPWDIRTGKSVNGILGELKTNCRNRTKTMTNQPLNGEVFNYSPVTINLTNHGITNGSEITVNFSQYIQNLPSGNYYAIIQTDNAIQLSYTATLAPITLSIPVPAPPTYLPTATITRNQGIGFITQTSDDFLAQSFPAWGAVTDCAGVDSSTVETDNNNVWRDVTTSNGNNTSTCEASPENCTFQDKISGLWWSKYQAASVTWSAAASTCENLNAFAHAGNISVGFNGKTGWRLPTQKELMEAYTHGIRSVPSDLGSSNNWMSNYIISNLFWSGSSVSWSPTNPESWAIHLAKGSVSNHSQTTVAYAICVR
jgi:hypothetical protein